MNKKLQSRRAFLSNCALAMTGAAFAAANIDYPLNSPMPQRIAAAGNANMICAFSKMFDFLGKDMFAFLADAGFQGIDLTVRPDGFVSYENVEKELAAAVNEAQKKGLAIPMIAAGLVDASDPITEKVLKAASEAGIKYYRLGYYTYKPDLSIEQNLELFKRNMQDLAALNAKYDIQGNYQNHVGGMFGGAVWDLWNVLREINSQYIGCQYDIRHAVAEGLSSWKHPLRAIAPYIGTLCVKDFIYEERNGKWGVRSVPLGTGAVDLKAYIRILKEENILAPMSIHFEFPLLTPADSSLSIKEKMQRMLPVVRKEVETLRIVFND